MEVWKDIKGFEGKYFVSNYGNVKSIMNDNKYMAGGISRGGYKSVCLTVNGRGSTKSVRIHQQVAISFIANLENKPFINHINGIKTDNRVENLEWITASENQKHAYSIGLKQKKQGKLNGMAKKIINIKTGEIYDTLTSAAKSINMHVSNFHKLINNNKTDFKYHDH